MVTLNAAIKIVYKAPAAGYSRELSLVYDHSLTENKAKPAFFTRSGLRD